MDAKSVSNYHVDGPKANKYERIMKSTFFGILRDKATIIEWRSRTANKRRMLTKAQRPERVAAVDYDDDDDDGSAGCLAGC